ncbi:MAG: hypothetical protein ACYC9I_13120 [Desulfuromonadales bacterium]
MKRHKLCFAVALFVTLSALAFASSALAVGCGGSPAKDALTKPYGLKVEGDAAGTKLSGVIEVSFSNVRCSLTDGCGTKIYNLADAKVALRLSRGENNTEAFYANLGSVPYDIAGPDVAAVQTAAVAALRPYILNKFFGAPMDPSPDVMIYLKDISPFSFATLDGSNFPNAEFAAIADLTIAVAY